MTWAIKEHDMCEIFMQHPRTAAHTYYSQYTEKETETTRRLKEQEKEADRLRCTPIPTLPFPPPPDPYQYNSTRHSQHYLIRKITLILKEVICAQKDENH